MGTIYDPGLPGGTLFEEPGAAGMFVSGQCAVHLTTCRVEGGDGHPEGLPCWYAYGGTGLAVFGWASDCSLVATQGCSLIGGLGGVAVPFSLCGAGLDGAPVAIGGCASVVDVPIAPMTMTAASPVRENTTLNVAVHAPAGAPVVLGVSTTPDAVYAPFLGAPLALAAPVLVVALGVTSVSGDLLVSFPLYAMPPGWDSAVFHGQGLYLDPLSQPVLGGAHVLVLLDDAL
jgi:hypothetical protein